MRDALIAFPGLLLVTGKFAEAKAVLLGLAARMRNGLDADASSPKTAPSRSIQRRRHSLWFVNAVWQYLRYTGDEATVAKKLLDASMQIIRTYHYGANLGIAADATACSNAARPGAGSRGWTRRSATGWSRRAPAGRSSSTRCGTTPSASPPSSAERFGHAARAPRAERARPTDRRRVQRTLLERDENVLLRRRRRPRRRPVDPPEPVARDQPAVRGAALERHAAVLERVRAELLTPVRPAHAVPARPGYHGRYGGDVVARDRAYHQGSRPPLAARPRWSPPTSASTAAATPREATPDDLLDGCSRACCARDGLGQLSELFDGDAPHRPGGAIASAPAVGELLRCYVEDILDQVAPRASTPEMPCHSVAPKVATKR